MPRRAAGLWAVFCSRKDDTSRPMLTVPLQGPAGRMQPRPVTVLKYSGWGSTSCLSALASSSQHPSEAWIAVHSLQVRNLGKHHLSRVTKLVSGRAELPTMLVISGVRATVISHQDRGLGMLTAPPTQRGGCVYTKTLSEGSNLILSLLGWGRCAGSEDRGTITNVVIEKCFVEDPPSCIPWHLTET